MPAEQRQTGIESLGEMPWGTHFCHFYETKQDLLDIVAALKVDLERKVYQRTSQLAAVNQRLQETQRKLEEAQRIAHVGHWERDLETDAITWSHEIHRIFGLRPQGRPLSFSEFLNLVAAGDRARVVHSTEEAVRNLRN